MNLSELLPIAKFMRNIFLKVQSADTFNSRRLQDLKDFNSSWILFMFKKEYNIFNAVLSICVFAWIAISQRNKGIVASIAVKQDLILFHYIAC